MASKGYPTDVLAQTAEVLAACKQIDPAMKAGTITQAAFADELAQTKAIQAQLHALELQMTDLRTRRDQHLAHMWDAVKRTRATVKGAYGDDSAEYKLVGGTRVSERKRISRRKAA